MSELEARSDLLAKRYLDLYSDYYRKGADPKRGIAAEQSVQYLRQAIGADAGSFDALLDVGAGEGSVLAQLSRYGVARQLFATEISQSGVEAIRSRNIPDLADIRLFDGYSLPYEDKRFDLAIAVHVIEHVEHERLLLREIARVARRVYIEVPLEHGFNIQRSIDSGKKFGHINFFTKETLRSLLESSGFEVTDCQVVAHSLKYEQFLSGRLLGWLKNEVRRGALTISPTLAPWFIGYNGYAYCKSPASVSRAQ